MEDFLQDQPSSQPGGTDRDEELARLREQLAFYESFDQLIQDNVTRAGALLREAATRHQDSELALRTTTAEFEQRQLAERVNYRKIFSALLDDVTTVQQNVERLARQVSDALDDLEAVIPAAGETAALESETLPSIPTFRSAAGELGAGEAVHGMAASPSGGEPLEHESEPGDELSTGGDVIMRQEDAGRDEVVEHGYRDHAEPVDELYPEDDSGGEPEPMTAQPAVSGPGTSTFSHIVQASVERISQTIGGRDAGQPSSEAAERAEEEDGITVDLAPTAEEADLDDDETNGGWADAGEAAATTLLVHGVPRATTALSLKRYLEGLDQVHSVEPREYAEGVLRLQVSSDRPVRLDDLQGWSEASALEPLAVRDDFVEVRLGQ